MTNRYSRYEKEKWASGPSGTNRRPPVKIPAIDNKALIEEHRFTLIGRVTNPATQQTRALVDFFLQHWKVENPITGRELGPHLFQFKFETEQDLQKVLLGAPYHFKRWMIILQRWEPIVSDFFPAHILFWVKIHGIPLHYWADKALETIGEELGPVEKYDVDQGRIRVWINGLKPLEMTLDISLPSGEIKQVELEYEELEKHCFLCNSLSHDRNDCPSVQAQSNVRPQPNPFMGISQTRTRERLDADRRRQDEKKQSRPGPTSLNGSYRQKACQRNSTPEIDWKNEKNFRFTYGARRDPDYQGSTHRELETPRRTTAKERLSFTRESASGSLRGPSSRNNNPISKSVWRPVIGGSHTGVNSKSIQTHGSHTPTPTPRPPREVMSRQATESPGSRQKSDEGSIPSQERRSALDRLSLPTERVPLLQDGVANLESGRLQEVDIRYMEDNQMNRSGGNDVPSSSRNPPVDVTGKYDPNQDRSPIRTLSEDRLYVSLRLGPIFVPESEEDVIIPITSKRNAATASTALVTIRNKNPSPALKRRTCRSPTHGASLKRRKVTKASTSFWEEIHLFQIVLGSQIGVGA
ncbi:hypothetical protein Bca4012_098020 [Brassica carinata]